MKQFLLKYKKELIVGILVYLFFLLKDLFINK